MARYRETHRKRREARARALAARREQAWAEARKAARLLKEEFGAQRVVLFGSLVREGGRFFDERSDIDLAVWGMGWRDLLRAWSRLNASPFTFAFDVMLIEDARPSLRERIEHEGVNL
ncbi:hypothetical protein SE16_11400 [Ardenticatena maritima]|uniref:Polymerase beta nucleotidyltransferase domain-containing protein n=1 Tax=Ardenticatena maritima TaxID=872965 RepID=A0A0N8GRT0_9CHLR|nr:hypothetical protein SE16_11400 [Ardenticatena maritima]